MLFFTVEADVLVTKAGSNLKLTCDGGPDSAVKTWQIDGAPVDKAGLENVFVTYDKSLLVQNTGELFCKKKKKCLNFQRF